LCKSCRTFIAAACSNILDNVYIWLVVAVIIFSFIASFIACFILLVIGALPARPIAIRRDNQSSGLYDVRYCLLHD